VLGTVSGNDGGHQFREVFGGCEGFGGAAARNGSGDAPGGPFFAVLVNDIGERFFRPRIDQLGGAQAAARVHSHVERAAAAEGKSPLRSVQLPAAHSEIQQNAFETADSFATENLRKQVEAAMKNVKCIWEGCLEWLGLRQRFLIPVEGNHRRPGFEQTAGMPSPAEGAVEDDASGGRREPLHHFVGHDGTVVAVSFGCRVGGQVFRFRRDGWADCHDRLLSLGADSPAAHSPPLPGEA